jgi:hypothetical protein
MVHWWVQVHFGHILSHTCFIVVFFHFWDVENLTKIYQKFQKFSQNCTKKKNPQNSPISFSKSFAQKQI